MNYFSNVTRAFFMAVMVMSLFTACQKEALSDLDTNLGTDTNVTSNPTTPTAGADVNYNRALLNGDSIDCFEINFPISVMMPDGSTVTGNTEMELETAIVAWLAANPGSDEWDIEPVFPISVTLADGSMQSIVDEPALDTLLFNCFGDDWDDDYCDDHDDDYDELCFEPVFPISVLMPDGTVVETLNEDELEQLFEDFFDAGLDSLDQFPTFVFPINVLDEDGNTLTVNSEAELDDLLDDCDDYDHDDDDDFECFTINYAVTLVLPDGSQVAVNNDDELWDAVETFYDANPNVDEDPTFLYPISVNLIDGTEVTVNNDDELEALIEGCDDERVVFNTPKTAPMRSVIR